MESFYGGPPGESFVLVKEYNSVADLQNDFSNPDFKDVLVGQYAVVNNPFNASEHGKIYRRTYDYEGEEKGSKFILQVALIPSYCENLDFQYFVKNYNEDTEEFTFNEDNHYYKKGSTSGSGDEEAIFIDPDEVRIQEILIKQNEVITPQPVYVWTRVEDNQWKTTVQMTFPQNSMEIFELTESSTEKKVSILNTGTNYLFKVNTENTSNSDNGKEIWGLDINALAQKVIERIGNNELIANAFVKNNFGNITTSNGIQIANPMVSAPFYIDFWINSLNKPVDENGVLDTNASKQFYHYVNGSWYEYDIEQTFSNQLWAYAYEAGFAEIKNGSMEKQENKYTGMVDGVQTTANLYKATNTGTTNFSFSLKENSAHYINNTSLIFGEEKATRSLMVFIKECTTTVNTTVKTQKSNSIWYYGKYIENGTLKTGWQIINDNVNALSSNLATQLNNFNTTWSQNTISINGNNSGVFTLNLDKPTVQTKSAMTLTYNATDKSLSITTGEAMPINGSLTSTATYNLTTINSNTLFNDLTLNVNPAND